MERFNAIWIKCTMCGAVITPQDLVDQYVKGESYGDQYEGDILVARLCPDCGTSDDYFTELEDEEFEDY